MLRIRQYVRWRKRDSDHIIMAKFSLQELGLSPIPPTALPTVLSLAACGRTEVEVWVGMCALTGHRGVKPGEGWIRWTERRRMRGKGEIKSAPMLPWNSGSACGVRGGIFRSYVYPS